MTVKGALRPGVLGLHRTSGAYYQVYNGSIDAGDNENHVFAAFEVPGKVLHVGWDTEAALGSSLSCDLVDAGTGGGSDVIIASTDNLNGVEDKNSGFSNAEMADGDMLQILVDDIATARGCRVTAVVKHYRGGDRMGIQRITGGYFVPYQGYIDAADNENNPFANLDRPGKVINCMHDSSGALGASLSQDLLDMGSAGTDTNVIIKSSDNLNGAEEVAPSANQEMADGDYLGLLMDDITAQDARVSAIVKHYRGGHRGGIQRVTKGYITTVQQMIEAADNETHYAGSVGQAGPFKVINQMLDTEAAMSASDSADLIDGGSAGTGTDVIIKSTDALNGPEEVAPSANQEMADGDYLGLLVDDLTTARTVRTSATIRLYR